MPRVPSLPSATVSSPAPTVQVTSLGIDGGSHLIEVFNRPSGLSAKVQHQIKVDGWYHVAWASSVDEVQLSLERVRLALKAGWLPTDGDLPA